MDGVQVNLLDYRFLQYDPDDDRDQLVHSTIPVCIDHDQEQIVIGVDLPHADGYTTTLDSDWTGRVPYLPPLDSEDEARRRLPELDYIQDEEWQDEAITLLQDEFREDYWHKPSSTSGNHHPNDERWQHGQWIHTKRVLTMFYRNLRNAARMEHTALQSKDIDQYLVAGILHDKDKFGRDTELDETFGDHAVTAAMWLEDQDYPDTISRAVERHTGPRVYDGAPEPVFLSEYLLHVADATAALYGSEHLLTDPAPEILFAQAKTRLQSQYRGNDPVQSYTVVPRNPDHLPTELVQ